MKKTLIFFVCFLGVAVAVPGLAQPKESKYRLSYTAPAIQESESPEKDADTTTLTFENGKIDEVDAYFEPIIADVHWGNMIHAVKTNWTPTAPADGTLWLKVSYDRLSPGNATEPLTDDDRLFRGKLTMPLGESNFSLGAYVAMYTASGYDIIPESAGAKRVVQPTIVINPAGIPQMAQAAFVGIPAEQGEIVTPDASVLKGLNPRRAVLGAVNFSGAIKGVDVSTEVGVTLGIEAGSENGDDLREHGAGNFPGGFENDFWSDSIIADGIPGDEGRNKLYAKVSATMNPIKKINVEGTLSCIKPMEAVNGTNIYGFEVNGAVYYSLTKYVKYLLKAGVVSFLENASLGESQYKLLNRVEFRF